jgi:putative metalloprotease
MVFKFLPILFAVAIFYVGFVYSSRNMSRQLQKNSSPLKNPIFQLHMTSFSKALDLDKLEIFILKDKQVNGLASPDGRIYITQGFFDQYDAGKVSSSEIASVIAHEMGHLALGHTKKRMLTFSAISALTFAISTILSRVIPYFGAIIGRYISQLVMAGLSRKDEFEADAYASALLLKAGIGTDSQISLLEKINKLTGVMSPKITWTMSHPLPVERVKAIKKLTSSWTAKNVIDRT